jgi:hypothetical protein
LRVEGLFERGGVKVEMAREVEQGEVVGGGHGVIVSGVGVVMSQSLNTAGAAVWRRARC